jgi:hypothetical protein
VGDQAGRSGVDSFLLFLSQLGPFLPFFAHLSKGDLYIEH